MRVAQVVAAAIVLGGSLAGVTTARAVPSASNSSIPSHVLMVGRLAALADTALGSFSIVVRDLANVPIAGATVEFRVLNCDGARLSANPLQPGVTARCATHGYTAVTNLYGEVRMCLVGGGTVGSPPGAGPCAQVFAGGVLLGTASVGIFDLDGAGGVAINDLAMWLTDFALNEPISRSDFDGSGTVTINDLSVWLEAWARGTSSEGATSYCP
jgi:hypothetical protein